MVQQRVKSVLSNGSISCFQPRPMGVEIMRDEDAADAASVTEKCSPEREERKGEGPGCVQVQAEGKLSPEKRLVTAGKQSVSKKPCVAKTTECFSPSVCNRLCVFFHSNPKILSAQEISPDLLLRFIPHRTHGTSQRTCVTSR